MCLPDDIIDAKALPLLQQHMRVLAPLPRGASLYREGDPCTSVYFLRSGSAKAVVTESAGREIVTGFYLPSDMVGGSSLGSERRADRMVVLERAGFCELPLAALEVLNRAGVDIYPRVLHKLAERMSQDRALLVRLSHDGADERVAGFLLLMHERLTALNRGSGTFTLPMSRYDIGSYLDLAPETVSRAIQRLGASDLISVSGRQIGIRDLAGLEAVALGPGQA